VSTRKITGAGLALQLAWRARSPSQRSRCDGVAGAAGLLVGRRPASVASTAMRRTGPRGASAWGRSGPRVGEHHRGACHCRPLRDLAASEQQQDSGSMAIRLRIEQETPQGTWRRAPGRRGLSVLVVVVGVVRVAGLSGSEVVPGIVRSAAVFLSYLRSRFLGAAAGFGRLLLAGLLRAWGGGRGLPAVGSGWRRAACRARGCDHQPPAPGRSSAFFTRFAAGTWAAWARATARRRARKRGLSTPPRRALLHQIDDLLAGQFHHIGEPLAGQQQWVARASVSPARRAREGFRLELPCRGAALGDRHR